MPSRRRVLTVLAIAAAMLAAAVVVVSRSPKSIVVAKSVTTSTEAPRAVVIVDEIPETTAPPATFPEPRYGPAVGLKVANGQPFKPAIPFVSNVAVPDHLVFVLVIGSDARPGHDPTRANGDSIHLLAVNPFSLEGTIVGFPRDAYVEIPGRDRGKLTSALAHGGPRLMAETVRRLTGLPIHYYVVTGFGGFERLVNDLGGVDIHVDRKMNDRFSGARFERGWHHFSGAEALAFSRNRKDVANGDFSRSEHQGQLILAALGKARSTIGGDAGLREWLQILLRHVRLDVPPEELPRLAALGRRLDPARVDNVVLPGRVGTAGRQSVVYLTADAPRLFEDLRADAVIGDPDLPPAPATASPSTTTTTTTTTAVSTTTLADEAELPAP